MKYIYSLCLILIVSTLAAQDVKKHLYYNEVALEYGIFSSLNPTNTPDMNGEIMKLKYTHFFGQKWGFQSGVNFITQLEGSDITYTIPLHFVYRSPIGSGGYVNNDAETFGGFLFSLILSFLPRQSEFFAGVNVGYLQPDNSIVMTNSYGELYPYYNAEQRFFSTIDLGGSFKYRIGRVGISLNPILSYLVSQNFKYYSDNIDVDGYSPKVFLNGTIGISYNF